MGCPNLLDENILQEFLELKSIVGERLAYLIYDKRNSFFRTNEDGLINQEFITRNKSFSSQRDTILSLAIEELENIDSDYIEKIKNSLNETNAIDNIKPEVKEIFESNPALANAIYEAAGVVQENNVLSTFTNYSGAAQGGDTLWENIGKEFGLGKQVNYRPEDLKKLTPEQLQEVENAYQQAVKDLGRKILDKNTFSGGLVRRDYLQAKAADAVFAISTIVEPGQKDSKGYVNKTNRPLVAGGTGYAVQMAINLGKPVYVFDQNKNQWFILNNNTFEETATPTLTSKFAGIGTREINENGEQAIREVYEKTTNTQPTPQQAQQLYSQYLSQNPNGSVEGFKELVQGKSFDKELAQKIQDKLQKLYPEIQLNITNNPVWEQGDNVFNQEITEVQKDLEGLELFTDVKEMIFYGICNNTARKCFLHLRDKNLNPFPISDEGSTISFTTGAPIKGSFTGHYVSVVALNNKLYIYDMPQNQYMSGEHITDKDMEMSAKLIGIYGSSEGTGAMSVKITKPFTPFLIPLELEELKAQYNMDDLMAANAIKSILNSGNDSSGSYQMLSPDYTTKQTPVSMETYIKQNIKNGDNYITELKNQYESIIENANKLKELRKEQEKINTLKEANDFINEPISEKDAIKVRNFTNRKIKLKSREYLPKKQSGFNYNIIGYNILGYLHNRVPGFTPSEYLNSLDVYLKSNNFIVDLFNEYKNADSNVYSKINEIERLKNRKKEFNSFISRVAEVGLKKALSEIPNDSFLHSISKLEKAKITSYKQEAAILIVKYKDTKKFLKLLESNKNTYDLLQELYQNIKVREKYSTLLNYLKTNNKNTDTLYAYIQNEIIRQYRHFSKTSNIKFQKDEFNKIIGQANIKAGTILINAIKQKQDTLPHEYAHHYIAWYRNTPIVQEAIKKWGSEEALVQSIGEQVVKQKGEAYNWWNKFVKWVMNQFNSLSKLQKEELTQILTDAFLTRQDLNNIGNNSFQQFQQSLNKPNTNPILQDNQQEQVPQHNEVNDLIPNTPEQLEIDFGQDYIGKNIKKTHNLFLEDKGSITTEEYEKLPYKDNGLTKTFYANSESDADYWVAKYGAIKVKLFGKDVGKYKMVIKKPFEVNDLPSSVEKLPKEIEEAINRKKNVIQALKLKISKDNSRSNELKSKINLLNSRINKIKEKYKSDDFKLYEIAYEDVKLISENLKSFEKTLEDSNLTSNELRIIVYKLVEVSYDIKGWIDVHNLVSEKYFGTEMDIANITGAIKMLDSKYKKILTNVFVRFAKLNTIYTELSEEDLSKAVADISIYDANVHTIGKSDIKLLKIVDDLLNNTATDINLEYQNKKTIINNQLKKAIDKLKISRNDLKEFFKQKYSDGTWTGDIIGEFKREFYDKQSELIEEAKESKNWGKYFKWLNKNSKSFTSKELVEISKMDEESITKIGRFSEKEVLQQKKLINDYRNFYMASVELLGKLDKYIDGELIINENESNEGISIEFKHDDAKIVDNFYYEIDSIIKENSPFEYLSNKEKKVNSKIKNVGYYYIIRNKPNENWEDPKFKEIKENETLMETYNMIMNTLDENNKYLPILDEYQSNYMPELAKPLLQRISNNGLIGMFGGLKNEIINSITEEVNNSEEIRPIIGSQTLNPIPIKMMSNNIITENKEDDIFKVLIEHSKMAISYKYKSQIEPLANASLDLIDVINEVSVKTTKAGSEYVTKFGKIKEREGGLVNAKKALKFRIESFLNNKSKDIEGVTKTKKKVKNLKGEVVEKNISLSKILDFLLGITYAKQLGAPNAISPTVNLAYGLVSNLSYAAGGVYVSEKNLIKSFMDLHSIAIGVNSKSEKTEKILTFIDSFGIFGNLYDTEVADSGFIQKITFLQQKAELINQGSLVLAILKTIKLKDKNGNDISIYDAYTIDNGHLKWDTTKMEAQELLGNDVVYNKEKTQINFKTLSSFINEIVEEVHGDYKNPMMIKKTVLMRAVMQYKRFIPNSVKHRFGKEYENMNLIDEKTGKRGVLVKGRYLSYINSKIFDENLNQYVDAKFGDIVKILISGLLFNKKNIQQLKEIDRINMMRNIRELHFILLSMAAIMALESLINDDDDNDFMVKILINSISKTQADMMFFLNPSAMSQMTNNFIPVLSTIEDMKNLIHSSFKMLYGDIYYENGPWKDYSRLGVSAMRLFPGTNGAVKMWNYGSQVFEFN